jgi:hypothetical protein
MNAEYLGYVEAPLGHWMAQYPGADGMIVEDYAERLELKVDAPFSWEPTPLWAKGSECVAIYHLTTEPPARAL